MYVRPLVIRYAPYYPSETLSYLSTELVTYYKVAILLGLANPNYLLVLSPVTRSFPNDNMSANIFLM